MLIRGVVWVATARLAVSLLPCSALWLDFGVMGLQSLWLEGAG
jgi:hypothetical protein